MWCILSECTCWASGCEPPIHICFYTIDNWCIMLRVNHLMGQSTAHQIVVSIWVSALMHGSCHSNVSPFDFFVYCDRHGHLSSFIPLYHTTNTHDRKLLNLRNYIVNMFIDSENVFHSRYSRKPSSAIHEYFFFQFEQSWNFELF